MRDAFTAIFGRLIADLAAAGENAPEEQKLAAFQQAVEALNTLDAENNHCIETVQREALCDLCWVVAKESSLDPSRYGGGEGPASIWRHW